MSNEFPKEVKRWVTSDGREYTVKDVACMNQQRLDEDIAHNARQEAARKFIEQIIGCRDGVSVKMFNGIINGIAQTKLSDVKDMFIDDTPQYTMNDLTTEETIVFNYIRNHIVSPGMLERSVEEMNLEDYDFRAALYSLLNKGLVKLNDQMELVVHLG